MSASSMDEPSSPTPWVSVTPWKDVHETPGAFPVSPNIEPRAHVVSTQHSLAAQLKARKHEYVRKKTTKVKVGTWNVASFHGTEKDLGAWFVHGLGVKGLSQKIARLSVESSPGETKDEHIESVTDQENRRRKKSSTVPKDDVSAVPSDDEIGLYVLGLQEVVDISSITGALRPYAGPDPAGKWKKAMEAALPRGYKEVAEHQLFGLLILIYAAPDIHHSITSVSATSVGTGVGGYLGNKGAASVRIVLGETTRLVFVNCHLAAGSDAVSLQRRIWDTEQIITRTRFSPVDHDSNGPESAFEVIGDEDFAFWFGDLNYRLDDIPGEDVRRLLLLHTRNEYDIINKSKIKIDSELGYVNAPAPPPASAPTPAPGAVDPAHYDMAEAEQPASESIAEPPLDPKTDPASLYTTLQALLQHDQLRHQQQLGKAFHDGWREGDINFLPTYKYDVGSVGMFDSGEKKRSPSWCDRILYRTRKDRMEYLQKAKLREQAKRRDADMKARGIDAAAAENDLLFDYNPATDGIAHDEYDEEEDVAKDPEVIQTREGFEDSIELDHYISHQRVLSSDHKPLDAIFTLTYDAVVPALKAQTHQNIAREMDKAENEGRPSLTLVVDSHSDNAQQADESAETSDMSIVDFGDVRYGTEKRRTLTLANTGFSPATFSFVGNPNEEDDTYKIFPQWLHIHFPDFSISADECVIEDESQRNEHTLLPGETISIELAILVLDPNTVQALNAGSVVLEAILLLRIEDGRDHFIPLKGVWQPSVFYRTLDDLVRLPAGGVRAAGVGNGSQRPSAVQSAPNELFVLTEAIPKTVTRAVAEWGMVHDGEVPPWEDLESRSAWPFLANSWTLASGEERSSYLGQIREALDIGADIGRFLEPELSAMTTLEVLAETLLEFLSSFVSGIITADMFSTIQDRIIQAEKFKKELSTADMQVTVMEILSSQPVHSVSFTFITFMLTRMVDELVALPPTESPRRKVSTRSRTSTVSSRSSVSSSESTSVSSSHVHRKGFFSHLRRTHEQRSGSQSVAVIEEGTALRTRRQRLAAAYVNVLSPVVIRSDPEGVKKDKEKRMVVERKRKVLEAFLQDG